MLALNAIFRLPKGELLVPDAPELVEKLLQNEQDLSTRRNAFQMLCTHAQERAVAYLLQNIDKVADWGDVLQMAVLDLIKKVGAHASVCVVRGMCVCMYVWGKLRSHVLLPDMSAPTSHPSTLQLPPHKPRRSAVPTLTRRAST